MKPPAGTSRMGCGSLNSAVAAADSMAYRFFTGVVFWLLSRAMALPAFYKAFGLAPTPRAAPVVFGLWFGLALFPLQPLGNAISRSQEFAADAFAVRSGAAVGDLSVGAEINLAI